MKKQSVLIVVVLFISCSSLMMSVKDRDDANKHITLKTGESVMVHMPEVRVELLDRIERAGWSKDEFCGRLQSELVSELMRRGIDAQADSSRDGNYLTTYIQEFKPGSALARSLDYGLIALGIGASKLEGTAILTTAEGRRELELKKQGESSYGETGDPKFDNIHYFAGALASKICAKSK